VTLAGVVLLRLLVPALDYFPPESLSRALERSGFVTAGIRKLVFASYGTAALVLLAVFFKAVQEHWPGRGPVKGLAFGTSLGIVWSFGFLTGWAFLGTTLRAELLNSVVDLVLLALGGWLLGLAVGRDVPKSDHKMSRPWLAVLFVAFGFVSVHSLGTALFADLVSPMSALLLVPTKPLQIVLLAGLGIWVGGMYVFLNAGLPFKNTWAWVAFFAFGVFGHSWTWFHCFFVIEFAGVLFTVLLVGLIGAVGVFAGALAYEWLARGSLR
jgi:hypothetical protein